MFTRYQLTTKCDYRFVFATFSLLYYLYFYCLVIFKISITYLIVDFNLKKMQHNRNICRKFNSRLDEKVQQHHSTPCSIKTTYFWLYSRISWSIFIILAPVDTNVRSHIWAFDSNKSRWPWMNSNVVSVMCYCDQTAEARITRFSLQSSTISQLYAY